MIAIAKVVIRTRPHLAAVETTEERADARADAFPKELIPVEEFNEAGGKDCRQGGDADGQATHRSMTQEWEPEQYNDETITNHWKS
jgi:non-homologous end joining protein Ku